MRTFFALIIFSFIALFPAFPQEAPSRLCRGSLPIGEGGERGPRAGGEASEASFSVEPIPDSVFVRMQGKSYAKGCTTPRSELRYLRCLHVTADGRTLVGEMVLHHSIADRVLTILRKLYDARYPIECMRLIDDYDANDERSMTANNSSAFNFRFVSGTRRVSKHGRGLAVDINPLYNPCRKTITKTQGGKTTTRTVVEPAAGRPYVDRTKRFDYKITRDDLCCRLFREAGFRWGGDWKHTKDYQHFEMP